VLRYLEKDEMYVHRLMGIHVVTKLIESYTLTGVTTSPLTIFTSQDLASERTLVVGTIRLKRKEIPVIRKLSTYDSMSYNSGPANLLNLQYQAKPSKTVVVIVHAA